MQATDAKPFSLEDFRPFLKSLEGSEGEAAVIGGMAVASWAEKLLHQEERREFDLPIYSKDLDLRGTRPICIMLAGMMQLDGAELTGLAAATRKEAPHMGKIHAAGMRWRGHRTTVEVLERLPGLDTSADEAPRGTHLKLWGGIPILDPCSLCICKLHAANSRPGEGANNDMMHLRILVRVIPRFLVNPTWRTGRRKWLFLRFCDAGSLDFPRGRRQNGL